MAALFRSQLNEFADEHERILASNDMLTLENQELRRRLGMPPDQTCAAGPDRSAVTMAHKGSLQSAVSESKFHVLHTPSTQSATVLSRGEYVIPHEVQLDLPDEVADDDVAETSLLPDKPRPTSTFDMKVHRTGPVANVETSAARWETYRAGRCSFEEGGDSSQGTATQELDIARGSLLSLDMARDDPEADKSQDADVLLERDNNDIHLRPSMANISQAKGLQFSDEIAEESACCQVAGFSGDPLPQKSPFLYQGSKCSLSSEDSLAVRIAQAQALDVLPAWFNPIRDDGEAVEVIKRNSLDMSGRHKLFYSTDKADPADLCVLTPLGRVRLTWDFLAFVFLLVEFWATPFELIFLSDIDTPRGIAYLSLSISCFFAADILLNFSTGYVCEDKIVMQRRAIFKEYVKFWLWIDILATLPFDLILESFGGMFSMARVGKASKAFKALKYLKMVRAIRLMKAVKQAGTLRQHFNLLGPLRQVMVPLQAFVFLVLLAHVNGCAWASMQLGLRMTDLGDCYRFYYQSICWAGIALITGTFGEGPSDTPFIWTLQFMLALERSILLLFLSKRVILTTLSHFDEAQQANSINTMLAFFRKHNVALSTQLQAMLSLTDAAKVRRQQGDYERLDELPQQLAPIIRHELWNDNLMSLGLIREMSLWHLDFTIELAQAVHEKNLPSRSIIFLSCAPATAAHCIVQGEVAAQVAYNWQRTPLIFKKSMWIGENALVSPVLLYSATCSTKVLTSLMVVPGEEFRQTVSKLGLMNRFELFCSEELWKGLCGRCGSLGNHFSDKCPDQAGFPQKLAQKVFGPLQNLSAETAAQWMNADSIDKVAMLEERKSKVAFTASTEMDRFTRFEDGIAQSENSNYYQQMGHRVSSASQISLRASSTSTRDWKNRVSGSSVKVRGAASSVVKNLLPGLHQTLSREASNPETVYVGRGLRRLLDEHGLEWLIPIFSVMKVRDLDDLERLDLNFLKSYLLQTPFQLTAEQEQLLTPHRINEFRKRSTQRVRQALFHDVSRLHHLVFLSHYKVEAGTEAALLRTELSVAISGDATNVGNNFDDPVFLDSDNLQNLNDLQERIRKTHNVVLLLTESVLTRPWVLLELVTTQREGVRVLLVNVCKPGTAFVFPDDVFFEQLRAGKLLDHTAETLLKQMGTSLQEVEKAIRTIFQQIAITYSPHKATEIRRAEIDALLKQCRLKGNEKRS